MGDERASRRRKVVPQPATEEVELFAGNPDAAWKVLSLVVDWIKQAETKGAGSLAAAGVVGGVLYNLVKDSHHPGWLLAVSTVLTAGMVIGTGLCAGLVFWPRLRHREDPTSPLFFHHIARKHDSPATYIQELSLLTCDNERLVTEIAEQVYWNSTVAHRKYVWASRALLGLLGALAGLAWVASIFGLRSIRG